MPGKVSSGRTVRADEVVLPLRPSDLEFIRITHEARLHFEQIEVAIACPFNLTIAGVVHYLAPENRNELGPFLQLYPGQLEAAFLEPDATLQLAFENGARLVVPPDEVYEAWEIFGPGESSIECAPGHAGKVVIWS